MHQGFKLKYDQMRGNDPASPGDNGASADNTYPAASNARNLGFVWPDGKRMFVGYSYMVCAEYEPEACVIILTFTSCVVTIKGKKLDLLYNELMDQLPRLIFIADERYNTVAEEETPVVNSITVLKNE